MFRAETRNLMKPVIRLEHIEKVFHDGKDDFEALRDVSLDVEEGDIFGIIGLSGAGKSTLVRCLNLLERPTSGKVFLHGQDMTALSPAAARRSAWSFSTSTFSCSAPFSATSASRWRSSA